MEDKLTDFEIKILEEIVNVFKGNRYCRDMLIGFFEVLTFSVYNNKSKELAEKLFETTDFIDKIVKLDDEPPTKTLQ